MPESQQRNKIWHSARRRYARSTATQQDLALCQKALCQKHSKATRSGALEIHLSMGQGAPTSESDHCFGVAAAAPKRGHATLPESAAKEAEQRDKGEADLASLGITPEHVRKKSNSFRRSQRHPSGGQHPPPPPPPKKN